MGGQRTLTPTLTSTLTLILILTLKADGRPVASRGRLRSVERHRQRAAVIRPRPARLDRRLEKQVSTPAPTLTLTLTLTRALALTLTLTLTLTLSSASTRGDGRLAPWEAAEASAEP